MTDLTTNTPPTSITREALDNALAALGLGFEGVTYVALVLRTSAGSPTVGVDWRDAGGNECSSNVAVTPPPPTEPLGLGAVVEDHRLWWVRTSGGQSGARVWWSGNLSRTWSDFRDVTVLTDGWVPQS